MNKIEITEKTVYEEIYDNFLKELENFLDISLSKKVKEKNNQLFQVLSNFSGNNLSDLQYYLFERNYSLEAMVGKKYILQYIKEYKNDIKIGKKLIGLYFRDLDNQIMIDRILIAEKVTFISKKMSKVRGITQKFIENILVGEGI